MEDKEAALLTEQGEAFTIPVDGSLGLLAYGYVGIMLWRDQRKKAEADSLAAQQPEGTGA